ncbi:unnamed protein product, partial [Choristocarpus tenellus]
DEVASVVGEIGSHTCKFGFGGEDSPKHVFTSTAGYLPSEGNIQDGGGAEVTPVAVGSQRGQGTGTTDGGKESGPGVGRGRGVWRVGEGAIAQRRDGMELRSPLVDGLLSDWDQVKRSAV